MEEQDALGILLANGWERVNGLNVVQSVTYHRELLALLAEGAGKTGEDFRKFQKKANSRAFKLARGRDWDSDFGPPDENADDGTWIRYFTRISAKRNAGNAECLRWAFENRLVEWSAIDPAAVPSRGAVQCLEWAKTTKGAQDMNQHFSSRGWANMGKDGSDQLQADDRKTNALMDSYEKEMAPDGLAEGTAEDL